MTKGDKKLAWIALVLAVIAMSSGGVWFALDDESAPIMRSSWRLMLTAVLQIPGFVYDWKNTTDQVISRWVQNMGLLILVGLSLAMHFASWSYSINHTPLTNSLLLVTTTPLMLICLTTLRFAVRKVRDALIPRTTSNELPTTSNSTERQALPKAKEGIYGWMQEIVSLTKENSMPPTLLETVGTAVGFFGVTILILNSSGAGGESNVQSSIKGDFAALLGAATIVLYLSAGSYLRRWMPLFMYAFPITLSAAILVIFMSLYFEADLNASIWGITPVSAFGFLRNWNIFGLSFGAALVSGIVGHTGANFALHHLPPLVISVSILWEPLVGSFMGWIVGVQDNPGVVTLLVAPLLLLGALLVILGDRKAGTRLDKAFFQKLWRIMRCKHWKLHQELDDKDSEYPNKSEDHMTRVYASEMPTDNACGSTESSQTSNQQDGNKSNVGLAQLSEGSVPVSLKAEDTPVCPRVDGVLGCGTGIDNDTIACSATTPSVPLSTSTLTSASVPKTEETPNATCQPYQPSNSQSTGPISPPTLVPPSTQSHVAVLVPGTAGNTAHLRNLGIFPWMHRSLAGDTSSFSPSTGYAYSYDLSETPAASPRRGSTAPSPTTPAHTPRALNPDHPRSFRSSASLANLSSRPSSFTNLRTLKHSSSGATLLSSQCSRASTPAHRQNPSLVVPNSTSTTRTSTPITIPKIASFVDMYSDPGEASPSPNCSFDSDAFKRTSSLYSFPSAHSLDKVEGGPLRALDILTMKNNPVAL